MRGGRRQARGGMFSRLRGGHAFSTGAGGSWREAAGAAASAATASEAAVPLASILVGQRRRQVADGNNVCHNGQKRFRHVGNPSLHPREGAPTSNRPPSSLPPIHVRPTQARRGHRRWDISGAKPPARVRGACAASRTRGRGERRSTMAAVPDPQPFPHRLKTSALMT
eukprot:364891-Chlamydomonas_euryale.AAC.8